MLKNVLSTKKKSNSIFIFCPTDSDTQIWDKIFNIKVKTLKAN